MGTQGFCLECHSNEIGNEGKITIAQELMGIWWAHGLNHVMMVKGDNLEEV